VKAVWADFEQTLKDYFVFEKNHPQLLDQMISENFLKPKHTISIFKPAKSQLLAESDDKQNLLESQEKLIRYLNLGRILLNSKFFFCEVASFPQILPILTQMLMSKNSVVSLLSSFVLKACI